MQNPAAAAPPYRPAAPIAPIDPPRARRWLWRIFSTMIFSVVFGGTLDNLWHATQPFDGFWSPPHIIVYVGCTITALMVFYVTFSPKLRPAFGRGFDLKILPFQVPGALFILGFGIVLAGFAGIVLDNIWHTSFGLDETNWSTPHAMIGWALLVVVLGFTACRLALRYNKPVRWYVAVLLGFLVISCTTSPFLGPFHGNRTPETVQVISEIPVLAGQPAFQHATRIQQRWNLNRTNPLLIVLGALWAGAALAFVRKLDKRWWVILLIVVLWAGADSGRSTVETFSQQLPQWAYLNKPANYLELPLLPAALVLLVLLGLRVPERWAWPLAGFIFALSVYSIWGSNPVWLLLTLVAAPLTLVGKSIGEYTYGLIERPFTLRSVMPLVLAAITMPCFTGAIDLYLRITTP